MNDYDVLPSQEQETRSTSHSFGFSFLICTLSSYFSIQGEMQMSHQTMVPPRASRTPLLKTRGADTQTYEDEDEDEELPATPVITRRYKATPKTTGPLATPKWDWKEIKYKSLQILLGALVIGLVTDTFGYAASEHWHYGDYPMTHLSANVGHGGTSDLFAFTSGHEVEVIEMIGEKANVYAVTLNTTERRLVTLKVIDTNGDIQVSIDGVAQHPYLLNTGKGFAWSVPR
jgi:hypothetical protein